MSIDKITKHIDEMFDIKREERIDVLGQWLVDGTMKRLPSKEKKKAILLDYFVHLFSEDVMYSEREVNDIIKSCYHDYATVRRYLIDYGYLKRKDNGSLYWINQDE